MYSLYQWAFRSNCHTNNISFAVPPEVRLLNNRMGQYVGRETILDCEIVAYPHGQMYWTKDSEDIDMSRKDKYLVELYSGNEDSKRKTLSIRVKNIQPQDFGDYTCVAKNYLGSDRETILLYGNLSLIL